MKFLKSRKIGSKNQNAKYFTDIDIQILFTIHKTINRYYVEYFAVLFVNEILLYILIVLFNVKVL